MLRGTQEDIVSIYEELDCKNKKQLENNKEFFEKNITIVKIKKEILEKRLEAVSQIS